jgi:cytochrome bd ubiquinol oxidase subunit II
MEIAWYALLGVFFAGYLVLGGLDYGVGLLLAAEPDPHRRRATLTAIGPFFLANEVWLVVTLGVLFGAFPELEGRLLAGFYPLVVLALAGVVLVTAAVQLRSRPAAPRTRARWDRVIIAGSALAALGWGALFGALLQGAGGFAGMFTPFVAASALALAAVLAVHGTAFLGLRMPADSRERWGARTRRLVPVALVAVAVAVVLGLLSQRVRDTVRSPLAAALVLLVLVAALLAAGRLAGGRSGWAFAATAVAAAAPVAAVIAATWPHALVGGLPVADAAAAPETLRLLGWLTVPLVPVLIGFQAMCWWVFRGRVDGRTPVYW